MYSTFSQSSLDKRTIVWRSVIMLTVLHVAALYGIYLFLYKVKIVTVCFICGYTSLGALGITAGVHRLWSHRAYKARLPLKIMLMLFNTIATQDSILHWARDHRMHHRYSETDADPHNATRGFFFAHMGWLMVKKHPKIKEKADSIDMSDLWADPVLRFQKKYYTPLLLLISVIIPSYIPSLWGETLWDAFFTCVVFRCVFVYHCTWLVNSAAHIWGNRPYDKNIHPAENRFVSLMAWGEGFHNYHHTYPWDYKTDEFGSSSLNWTAIFIDLMAKIGWAYDLKTVPAEVIEARKSRTGDGSHNRDTNNNEICKTE